MIMTVGSANTMSGSLTDTYIDGRRQAGDDNIVTAEKDHRFVADYMDYNVARCAMLGCDARMRCAML